MDQELYENILRVGGRGGRLMKRIPVEKNPKEPRRGRR
jgi:hypothetical protein